MPDRSSDVFCSDMQCKFFARGQLIEERLIGVICSNTETLDAFRFSAAADRSASSLEFGCPSVTTTTAARSVNLAARSKSAARSVLPPTIPVRRAVTFFSKLALCTVDRIPSRLDLQILRAPSHTHRELRIWKSRWRRFLPEISYPPSCFRRCR